MKKTKKWIKILLIVCALILVPSLIVVAILYADDKRLLHQFQQWVSIPGNLSVFLVGIAAYFPFINGVWKVVLNIISSVNMKKTISRSKLNKEKIYDDDKYNYIYYDSKNHILDFQFKSPEEVNLNKLIELSTAELKQKAKVYDKNHK